MPSREPLIHAEAQANWLKELVDDLTGKRGKSLGVESKGTTRFFGERKFHFDHR